MRSMRCVYILLALVLVVLPATGSAGEGWELYDSEEYGFSMLVPQGAKLKEKEWSGGWGGLYGTHAGVELWGLAKLGEKATADEIERFALKLTKTDADDWSTLTTGKDEGGWIWYRIVKASEGSNVYLAGYGTGPKGSYLLVLRTTADDYRDNKSVYVRWSESVRLR